MRRTAVLPCEPQAPDLRGTIPNLVPGGDEGPSRNAQSVVFDLRSIQLAADAEAARRVRFALARKAERLAQRGGDHRGRLREYGRPAGELPGLARLAVELGARALWLEPGSASPEARDIAETGGLAFVEGVDIAEAVRSAGIPLR